MQLQCTPARAGDASCVLAIPPPKKRTKKPAPGPSGSPSLTLSMVHLGGLLSSRLSRRQLLAFSQWFRLAWLPSCLLSMARTALKECSAARGRGFLHGDGGHGDHRPLAGHGEALSSRCRGCANPKLKGVQRKSWHPAPHHPQHSLRALQHPGHGLHQRVEALSPLLVSLQPVDNGADDGRPPLGHGVGACGVEKDMEMGCPRPARCPHAAPGGRRPHRSPPPSRS